MLGENILVIYSSKNTKGRHDATGAFIPEAYAFHRLHNVPEENMLAIPCPGTNFQDRYEKLCRFIDTKFGVKWIAMFCHGYSSGLQFGLNKKNISDFTATLRHSCNDDLSMTLYACSTASVNRKKRKISAPGTDGGYADELRDSMLRRGFRGGWIDAHLTSGHTTMNPYVMRFHVEPAFDDDWNIKGGQWLVHPRSPRWKIWKNELKHGYKDGILRFHFPQFSEVEISSLLRRRKSGATYQPK